MQGTAVVALLQSVYGNIAEVFSKHMPAISSRCRLLIRSYRQKKSHLQESFPKSLVRLKGKTGYYRQHLHCRRLAAYKKKELLERSSVKYLTLNPTMNFLCSEAIPGELHTWRAFVQWHR